MATFKPVILKGKCHQKSDGTSNIKIRIYHNGTVQYVSTEYFIEPSFMGRDGSILPACINAESFNYELGEILQHFRTICIKLGSYRTQKMTCLELKDELLKQINPENEVIDFVAFSQKIIDNVPKKKTSEWYQDSIHSFSNFYNSKVININDIRSRTLEEFKEYLFNRNVKPGTVSNYLRGLRALYNRAKKHYNNEDFNIIRIPSNPFSKVDIPQYVRTRKNISMFDIMRIRDAEFDRERICMARDVFMMSFYMMGINMYDFFCLPGETYGRIVYERSKVDTDTSNRRFALSIKVEPELRVLIDKYSPNGFLSYFHDRYTNYNNFLKAVNKELKEISKELNLGVPLSSNWARHSWASIARNKAGISKADVDFCLGHVNNDYKMADIYIDIDYSVCDKANRAVLDLLEKK
jgi:hypothetical protein